VKQGGSVRELVTHNLKGEDGDDEEKECCPISLVQVSSSTAISNTANGEGTTFTFLGSVYGTEGGAMEQYLHEFGKITALNVVVGLHENISKN